MPTLPEELLALIFEQVASPGMLEVDAQLDELDEQDETENRSILMLDHSARISTLRNICLASKTLHRLAWPILYREFSNRQTKDMEGKGEEPGYETATRKLLRTICLTPHYGLALRNLLIRAWVPVEAMRSEELFDLLQSDATVSALFQWRARGFWFQEPKFIDSLHRALGLGHEDGLVTLLLIMCPNLKELEFEPPIDFDRSVFLYLLGIVQSPQFQEESLPEMEPDFEQEEADYIIAQMFGAPWPNQRWCKPLFLQSLSKLTLWSPGLADLDMECIVKILTLPSLVSFKVYGMNFGYGRAKVHQAFNSIMRDSNLRRLELLEISTGSGILAAILQFCPELEEFGVVWDEPRPTGDYCLWYGDISESLGKFTPRLRRLTLDGSHGWENGDAEPHFPFTIGDKLDSLANLEHLTLDPHAIYGSEYGFFGSGLAANVPKSVTNLTLVTAHFDTENDQIKEYHAWQDKDLVAFLQDPTFDCLSDVHLSRRLSRSQFSAQDQAAVEKHGWKRLLEPGDETSVRLVNPSRSRIDRGPSITRTT